jgi:CRP-like cAMP-binding protein
MITIKHAGTLEPLSDRQKRTLCGIGWLATCDQSFQQDFLRLGGVKRLKPGDELYRQGQVSSHVFGLISGQIDIQLTAATNEELVYPFSAPGRWYGLADVVAQVSAFGTAVAGRTSLVFCVSQQELLEFLDARPERYRKIVAHEYALRRQIQETVTDLVTSDGPELVARRLVRLMEFDGVDASTSFNISQFEFASALGVSVPTVQRAFRELRKYGAIETTYGKVTVRNVAKLKEFVLSFDG